MRKIAFLTLLIAAISSLLLVLNAGSHAPPLLLILFVGWVLSPYIAISLLSFVHKLQLVISTNVLYWLILVVSLGSLAAYGVTLLQDRIKTPTGVYLSVPFLSWILIAASIAITAFRKRKILKT